MKHTYKMADEKIHPSTRQVWIMESWTGHSRALSAPTKEVLITAFEQWCSRSDVRNDRRKFVTPIGVLGNPEVYSSR